MTRLQSLTRKLRPLLLVAAGAALLSLGACDDSTGTTSQDLAVGQDAATPDLSVGHDMRQPPSDGGEIGDGGGHD